MAIVYSSEVQGSFFISVGAQDYFRLAGGVADTANLIETSSCPLSALPAALFCLACAVKKNGTKSYELDC